MSLNAVKLQGQDFVLELNVQSADKKEKAKGAEIPKTEFKSELKNEPKEDEFVINSKKNSDNGEKVGLKEGAKLVGEGFLGKIKNTVTSIVHHPVKTALAIGATSACILAAPVAGIASATAASILAVGFAGFALGKTAGDVIQTVKDNNDGKYNEVRKDLKNIGGDGVDLALSLPFAPKAINQVSRFAKYGRGTVGINRELITNLKNSKNFAEAELALEKANAIINYEMIGNEMGLAVKPKLEFKNMLCEIDSRIIGGAYEPAEGKILINENILTGEARSFVEKNGMHPELVLRHELEHARQFIDIARTENYGVNGLKDELIKYYSQAAPRTTIEKCNVTGMSKYTYDNMATGDRSVFNQRFYEQQIKDQGVIKQGTEEAKAASEYAQGLQEKINPPLDRIQEYRDTIKGIDFTNMTPADRKLVKEALMKLYKSNILEKKAFDAQDKYFADVMKNRPKAGHDILMAAATADDLA